MKSKLTAREVNREARRRIDEKLHDCQYPSTVDDFLEQYREAVAQRRGNDSRAVRAYERLVSALDGARLIAYDDSQSDSALDLRAFFELLKPHAEQWVTETISMKRAGVDATRARARRSSDRTRVILHCEAFGVPWSLNLRPAKRPWCDGQPVYGKAKKRDIALILLAVLEDPLGVKPIVQSGADGTRGSSKTANDVFESILKTEMDNVKRLQRVQRVGKRATTTRAVASPPIAKPKRKTRNRTP